MSQSNFNTSHPEQLIYENELLRITILGGIKLEGLDRMRVTLKLELKETSVPPIRHNLDLYNDTQLEKLVRKSADRLEVGTSIVLASLVELTELLEKYRIEKIEENQDDSYKPKELSKKERQEAEDFLKSADLLEKTNELIGKSGVIGEEINRIIMYLIFTSRKTEKPLHVVSLGASGTGKTHLQESVANLIPTEDRIEITTLSENAFYYFGRTDLVHKLILIEDLDGAEGALYPIRELQSKKRITKTISQKSSTGQTKTITLTVEGPVSVAGCTTKEQIYEDNANRSFLLYLDESGEQDGRIMDFQRKLSAGKINHQDQEKAIELLCNCQRILQPIKVVNPYAEQLKLPKEVFKPRRTNNHYLQFIEAVTFYFQKQRAEQVDEATGEVYIETTLEDIQIANELLKDTLLRKSDNLTGACRNYFEVLKTYLLGLKQKTFTNREISLKLRISIATVKRHHLDLYNCGYLKIAKKDRLKGYEYEIVSYEEYQQLQEGITGVLENSLKNLSSEKWLNGSKVAQSPNEPPKRQKTRKKGAVAQ